MATKKEGRSILIDTIKDNITHQDYKRVTDLALLYRQIITGDQIDDLLKQFVRREDDEMFKQRVNLTQQITPSVSYSISRPFYKVGRVNNIQKKISFKEDNEAKLKNLNDAISTYYGDKSLDKYLETRLVQLVFTDPNSFIVTEFDPFDPIKTKAQPRPFEVSSTSAVNYLYKNNILQWLIVKNGITYTIAEGKTKEGCKYTIYLDNDALVFTQVDVENYKFIKIGETGVIEYNGEILEVIRIDENRAFLIQEYEYKAGRVPAIRVGYEVDLTTDGRTMVSPIEPAIPYFKKSIKTVSEFDLTMALHAFPQKFAYVARCTDTNCDNGKTPEGANCKTCKGSGSVPLHSSAQDAVTIRMPKKEDWGNAFSLDNLAVYKYPPVELLKFQDEQIDKLEYKCHKALYNSQMFAQNQLVKTATEVDVNLDSVYDTLFPFAQKYSEVYVYISHIIARFRDINDAEFIHTFPKDFKFKGVDELIAELKLASESGAPGYIKQEISKDIADRQFQDKPEELKRILSKQKHFPFADKTATEIIYIISNNKTSLFNEVLWANFDMIFQEIEIEDPEFFNKTFPLQKELIKAKVEGLMAELKVAEKSTSFGIFGE